MEHMQVPIPAGAGPAVLVAIELSKMTWLLAVYDPFGCKVSSSPGIEMATAAGRAEPALLSGIPLCRIPKNEPARPKSG